MQNDKELLEAIGGFSDSFKNSKNLPKQVQPNDTAVDTSSEGDQPVPGAEGTPAPPETPVQDGGTQDNVAQPGGEPNDTETPSEVGDADGVQENQTSSLLSGLNFDYSGIEDAPGDGVDTPSEPVTYDFSSWKDKLGVDIEGVDDVVKWGEQQKVNAIREYFPGANQEILEAYRNGIISEQELITGNSLNAYENASTEDLFRDFYLRNGKSAEEVSELWEEAGGASRDAVARSHQHVMMMKREALLSQVKQSLDAHKLQAQQQIEQSEAAFKEFVGGVKKAVEGLDVIEGTTTKLSPDEKRSVMAVMANPENLKKVLFGNDLSKPDYTRATNLVASLLFSDKVRQDLQASGEQNARGKMLRETQNPQVRQSGKPITAKGGQSSISQALDAGIQQWAGQFK